MLHRIPLPSYSGKGNKQKKGTKLKSEVLTATPMKLILEEKQQKKNKRVLAKKDKQEKIKESQPPCKKPKNKRKMEFDSETSEEDEVDEKDLVDDDELDDVEVGMSNQTDQCLICQDFGKNGEIWFRCVICGGWAHAECSGQDSATDYTCDFCYKKKNTKKDLVLNF